MSLPDLYRIACRWLMLGLVANLLWMGKAPEAAAGTAGSLDSTFNGTGKVLTDPSGLGLFNEVRGVAIQSDGKIVVAGRSGVDATHFSFFTVGRYNTDGTRDTSFGTQGAVFTDFGQGGAEGRALAIQGDGKIVVAGRSCAAVACQAIDGRFALARYNTDGTLDRRAFGTGGQVLTDFRDGAAIGADVATALAIQKDGKIVVAGYSIFFGNQRIALARYNTDGTLDSTFGTGGRVLTDRGACVVTVTTELLVFIPMTIQSDGKIVVGSTGGSDCSNFAVFRYNADGTLDSSFGTGGKVVTPVGCQPPVLAIQTVMATALAIQGDGKIVVAGFSTDSGCFNTGFTLARYNTDGTLDSSFGTSGTVLTSVGGLFGIATAVVVQKDGKIVVAGFANFLFAADFALARYNTNGTLDKCTFAQLVDPFGTCFGTDTSGTVLTHFGPTTSATISVANAIALQSDRSIVVGGTSNALGPFDFALARYLNDTVSVLTQ